jgi:hypothetical protein
LRQPLTVPHPRRLGRLGGLVLFALLVASACDKPNDLPRMQDELLTSARAYRSRFDELKRRAEVLDPRTRALPQDAATASAQHTLGVARTTIEQNLAHLQQLPTMLPRWTASENSRGLLQAWLDEKRPELEAGVIEATAELAAVESAIAVAEQRAGEPQPAAPPPQAEPMPEEREPQTDGSGAPIR